MKSQTSLIVKALGLQDYQPVYERMTSFTQQRTSGDQDQLWVLQHNPVYTLGRNANEQHVLNSGKIPVVQVDRGGQVTYHGPGQLIAYLLIDVKRRGLGVRQMVTLLEESVIDLLARHGISAQARPKAPGVYVNEEKIAALGLRIKNGRSYHGLSLNVDMDLAPFNGINPCGYENLRVTQMVNHDKSITLDAISCELVETLAQKFAYDTLQYS